MFPYPVSLLVIYGAHKIRSHSLPRGRLASAVCSAYAKTETSARVTIVGIVRLVLLVQGLFMLIELPDPTANIGFVTSAIETNLFLITASAPALRPLLRAWFPRVFVGPNGRDDDEEGGLRKLGRTARRVVNGGVTTVRTATQSQTRLTRMKSATTQTGLRSQSRSPTRNSQEKEEEDAAARAFNGVMARSDIIVRYGPQFGSGSLVEEGRDGVVTGKWL